MRVQYHSLKAVCLVLLGSAVTLSAGCSSKPATVASQSPSKAHAQAAAHAQAVAKDTALRIQFINARADLSPQEKKESVARLQEQMAAVNVEPPTMAQAAAAQMQQMRMQEITKAHDFSARMQVINKDSRLSPEEKQASIQRLRAHM